jgi:hypothetical protein
VVEGPDAVEQGAHRRLVRHVDLDLPRSLDWLAIGDRAAPGHDDLGAQLYCRPGRRQAHATSAADDHDALA